MIIRILNKAQYLKLFFFFAMGIVVGYELNAESFQIEKKILIHSNYIQKI